MQMSPSIILGAKSLGAEENKAQMCFANVLVTICVYEAAS